MSEVCTMPDCQRLRKYRGWCGTHYERWRKHGDPNALPVKKTKCEAEGCDRRPTARGLCKTHYSRWRTHGDANAKVKSPGEGRKYFEEKVLSYKGDDCLPWPFARNAAGYGILNNNGGSSVVSRMVCERIRGLQPSPIHEARHLCGKGHEACCAPAHIDWGTPHENQMDRVAHGTHIRGERHPLHKLTEFQAREALRLKGFVSQNELAEMFGVKRATISHVQNRTTWAWL